MSTPEGAALRLQLADGGERVGAFMIDLLIILTVLIALTVAVFTMFLSLESRAGTEAAAVIWLLGFFVLRNFYFALFEGSGRAATPGKRLLKLRVAARDGGRLGFSRVVARNMMRELELFLPLSFLVAGLAGETVDAWTGLAGLGWTVLFAAFPWLNRDRLRVGDLVAGSWVVHAPRPALLPDLADMGRARGPRFAFTDAQLDAYGVYELQTLETVLREDNADALAVSAAAIRKRIGWAGREPDAAFLSAYYAALRARLERGLLFGRRRENKGEPVSAGARRPDRAVGADRRA